MFKVVTPDNIREIMEEMKKMPKSYVMDYNDIQRFIQEKNMNDVELVPMEHICISDDARRQLMDDISRDLNDKMLSALNKNAHDEDFCKRVIYKTMDNTDNHAYCFIFGRSNGHLYVITQKTGPDKTVLNNLFLNNKKSREFGVPFLWNSLKDELSCGFTGLTMLQKLTAKNIKNIVTNSKYNIVSNSRNWAKEKPSAKTHKNDTRNFYFLNKQPVAEADYDKMSGKDKEKVEKYASLYQTIDPTDPNVIPNDMMKVSQNVDGIEKCRPNVYQELVRDQHIQNTNGVKYNTYAQKKIKEFKGLK